MKTNNKLRVRLLISLGSIFLTLFLMEGFVRVVLGVQPAQERYILHSRMGWEWTPGFSAVETDKGFEYYLEISDQGLSHSPVYEIPKPPDTYRILALGDSVTHGLYVEPENKFVNRLQDLLQADSGAMRIEVLNGGTDDYGLEQESYWLQERGLTFEPDLVILTVYMNDGRPTERVNPMTAAGFNFLISRSAAYYFYTQLIRGQLIQQETAQEDFRFRYLADLETEAWRTDPEALSELIRSADGDWGLPWTDQGMSDLIGNLDWLLALARDEGLPVLVVISPASVQVYAEVDPAAGLPRLDYPQSVIVDHLTTTGIPVLDLLPILKQQTQIELFLDQSHYSPPGHEIVAGAIYTALSDMGFLPGR